MKSEPGQYHGFFWFYFLNEHVFRFLNMRYPRDYNTVPRWLFWGFHLLVVLPVVGVPARHGQAELQACRSGRAHAPACSLLDRLRDVLLHSVDHPGILLDAYLSGSSAAAWLRHGERRALHRRQRCWLRWGLLCAAACGFILGQVWSLPTPGDISNALRTQDFEAYTLSLGHMGDLTLRAFAYLRTPLAIAALSFLLLAYAGWRLRGRSLYLTIAASSVLFLNSARLAMITFDPYLASRPLAEVLRHAPPGRLIVDNQYYTFSSVFFYAQPVEALLLRGRQTNLEYGSYAPGAPDVFIDDAKFQQLWREPSRYYLVAERPEVARIEKLTGRDMLYLIKEAGGKYLWTNRPYSVEARARLR